MFGIFVGCLWVLTNLGSKFWQARWEHRLRLVEGQLGQDTNLFSAKWELVQDDVAQSFRFRKRGRLHQFYARLVLTKPSVSLVMTLLSVGSTNFWVAVLIVTLRGF